MMTKEEVAKVIAYCDENKISYKQRLEELRINPWSFYDAKRKYALKEEGENSGEFLQLVPGGSFLPNPIKPSRSRSSKQKDSAQGAVAVSIELRTPTGTMMRISGNLPGRQFTCLEWKETCAEHPEMRISMDGRGRAKDNIWIERFWRTIKYEYIYIQPEENGAALYQGILRFIDDYNYHRHHQGIDRQIPSKLYLRSAA